MSDPNTALIDSWRLSLHDKRPTTQVLYTDIVARFATFLRDNGRPDDLLEVPRRDIEAWFADMTNRGLSQSTKRSRWIALRSFYKFLTVEEEISVDPTDGVRVAKADPPPVDLLTEDQLHALFAACAGTSFYDRRDLAIIRMMAAAGVRLGEVAGLAVADVDLQNRLVTIRHAKGDRMRMVRIDAATASAVDRYKRARARHKLADRPELWLGFRGPFGRKGIPGILSKRAEAAGIGHVHPHQLRHTWAHMWLARGGTEGDLQKLGGWANADVMRRYGSALAVDRALNAYDRVMGTL